MAHGPRWFVGAHLSCQPAVGVMFISVGPPVPPGQRPTVDLSAYRSLVVDLRAAVDGQCMRIGVKDKNQPDNGSEISVRRCLTT